MRFCRTPFTYSYVANASLIDTVSQAGGYSRDYDYLSTSNRLDQMKHQWGTSSASAVETRVTYDPSSRLRNTEKTQGTAWMSVLGRSGESGVHTDYSYTDRYELTSSGKYVLQPDWTVGAAAAGTARDYAFDPIGNRMSDQAGSYTPNELNQYTATPTATTLTYDANGNLTGDGAATYAYDAENRLITMNRDHGASSHYTYDYLGRRIRRTATGMTTQRYLYDGWNLIAELDDSGTITRQFVWGLDVSGSAQGAGGVGGLLEIDAGGTSQYYPIYDASHNVIGLYSGTGAIAAAYEYDPFGNKQTGLGTYAAANPFRFSTKYTDPDSGLVYYGMRYYSAKLGRFLNQDPIEEAGGINLYAFCGNDGVNHYDLLGMDGGFFDWLGGLFGGGSGSNNSGSSSGSGRVEHIDDNTVRDETGQTWVWIDHRTDTGSSGNWYRSDGSDDNSTSYDAMGAYNLQNTLDALNESKNGPSAVDLGFEWITGMGPRNRTFVAGDQVTTEIQKSREVRDARMGMNAQIAKGDYSTYRFGRNLRNESRLSFVISFGVDLIVNRTRAYLGSFSGEIKVLKVKDGVATLAFTIKNFSGLESATRLPPPYGYSLRSDGSPRPSLVEMPGNLGDIHELSDLMPKSILPDNYYNFLGLKPGSNTSQTIIWFEPMPFSSK